MKILFSKMIYFLVKRNLMHVLVFSICLFLPGFTPGQDVQQLAMRARINLYDNWNFDSVAYYFNQVIGKKHTPAFAYSDYGWYLMLRHEFEEGLSFIEQAAEKDPSDKQLLAWNAWALLWKRDFKKAKLWIDQALAIDPDYGEALQVSSRIASELGNHSEALRLAEKAASNDHGWRAMIPLALARAGNRSRALEFAEEISKNESVSDVILLMEVYAHLDKDDKALAYMQKSYQLRHPFMPWLELIPGLEHLHDDLRFKEIIEKMNLPK